MKFSAFFVTLALLLITSLAYYPFSKPVSPTDHPPLKFLALGDSYTIGESVAPEERWPIQLAVQLRASGIEVDAPEILARTGWTTDELADAIVKAHFSPSYDLVSLLIGVNNQYRGYSQETYRQEFAALLEQAITFAGGAPDRVIVLSIPDWGVTPFGANDARGRTPAQISAEIAAFNAINRAETLRLGAHYVDITPISQEAGRDSTLLAPDDLHPSGKMYGRWVAAVLKVFG